ncbi:hypothetical protein BV898_17068 [Hypsibius exemplaris]|uniref:Uncharacterized protein n=1 Tax=Hypsibius exemplaris TaxID=2072580 RepID=A0A9X6NEF0_HYPEX|nr:hypothetical protein BV898_17068 [Hypsibius exemplaris]
MCVCNVSARDTLMLSEEEHPIGTVMCGLAEPLDITPFHGYKVSLGPCPEPKREDAVAIGCQPGNAGEALCKRARLGPKCCSYGSTNFYSY